MNFAPQDPSVEPTMEVAVRIVRFVCEHQPNIVACELVDADGRLHTIIDKDAMFSEEYLDEASPYPLPGAILCQLMNRWRDESGRELVRVNTGGVESDEGLSEFVVVATQISESNEYTVHKETP